MKKIVKNYKLGKDCFLYLLMRDAIKRYQKGNITIKSYLIIEDEKSSTFRLYIERWRLCK